MKRTSILAIAITAMFCVGFLPILADTDVSAAEGEGLQAGQAYGQNFRLDYETLEKYIKEEMGLGTDADLKKIAGDAIAAYLQESNGDDILTLDSFSIGNLDFDMTIASLVQVVTAGEEGYKLEFEAGVGVSASVNVTIGGTLPKAGTYDIGQGPAEGETEERTVSFGLDVSAGIVVEGTMDIGPDGVIKSATVGFDVRASVTLSSGVDILISEDQGVQTITIAYRNVVYSASANLQASVGMTFALDGSNYKLSFSDLSITGNIWMNDGLKSFIDSAVGEEDFVDNKVMNMTVSGVKMIENGALNLNSILAIADTNDFLTALDIPATVPYDSTVTAETVVKSFSIPKILTDNLPADLIPAGSEGLFADLEPKELTAEQVNEIKTVMDDVKTGGSGGDGGNILLYVGIGVAAVVLAGAAFVFIRRH